MLRTDSPNETAARADAARNAVRTAVASAQVSAARAFAAVLAIADDAPTGALAAWLAAGGDASAPDAIVGAFVAGLAEHVARGGGVGADAGLASRLEALARDGLAVCFFGNALVAPLPSHTTALVDSLD